MEESKLLLTNGAYRVSLRAVKDIIILILVAMEHLFNPDNF